MPSAIKGDWCAWLVICEHTGGRRFEYQQEALCPGGAMVMVYDLIEYMERRHRYGVPERVVVELACQIELEVKGGQQ